MRVLIVDDHPEVCQLHARFLRLLGHEPFCLQDARQALDEAKRLKPQVALLDICMPGMNGWEVAEQLRADPDTQHIRLVAITALTGSNDMVRSNEAGFDAHYRKPVSINQWPQVLAG